MSRLEHVWYTCDEDKVVKVKLLGIPERGVRCPVQDLLLVGVFCWLGRCITVRLALSYEGGNLFGMSPGHSASAGFEMFMMSGHWNVARSSCLESIR